VNVSEKKGKKKKEKREKRESGIKHGNKAMTGFHKSKR
jgi:hypothetical protein